ncbi:MAG: AMP-binding protein [Sedimenticola sp.]
MNTLAIFPDADAQTPVAYNNGCLVTYAEMFNDVATLTKRLPNEKYQINLCENRYYFLVAFLAALRLGQTVILPPSLAEREIESIKSKHSSSYRLFDSKSNGDSRAVYLPGILNDCITEDADSINFPSQQIAVKLYTSGSTGDPVAHIKTWGMLYQGASLTGRMLSMSNLKRFTLMATVPQQHMYGLETSIMLPLVLNGIVTADKPLLPGDIGSYAKELAGLSYPLLFATTPLHISCCIKTKVDAGDIGMIISATSPLTRIVAKEAEELFSTELNELYGSTETGAIAYRHTAREESWNLFPGTELYAEQALFIVKPAHYETPVRLHDNVEITGNNSFRLLGRNSDLIKIAGKRASLGYLNAKLLEIDEVDDAVFYIPDSSTNRTVRCCAFVVAKALSREKLICELKERIDPAFIPRNILFVSRLPRNATGKISRENLTDLYNNLC